MLARIAEARPQAAIEGFYRANPLLVLATFFAIYVILTALSVPGAVIMTLGAGDVSSLAPIIVEGLSRRFGQ
mgnify:CR=1 FL=1